MAPGRINPCFVEIGGTTMKNLRTTLCEFIMTAALLSACGGNGNPAAPSETQPTRATLILSSAITGSIPSGTIIAGYDVTISLPAGVTVKSTVAPPLTDDGVVTHMTSTAPPNTIMFGIYTAATDTLPGNVRIITAKADGFSAGNFTIVNGNIAAGYRPTAADFLQPTYTVSDDTGANLTGQLSITASAYIR
jgi:hypothetical protein